MIAFRSQLVERVGSDPALLAQLNEQQHPQLHRKSASDVATPISPSNETKTSGASTADEGGLLHQAPQQTANEPAAGNKSGKSANRLNTRMVLRDAAQFYNWHNDLMESQAHRRDEQYKQYATLLESYLQVCDGIIVQIDGVSELFELLALKQQESRKKVIGMLDTFRQLDGECQALQKVADSLALRTSPTIAPQPSGSYAGSYAGSAVGVSVGRSTSFGSPDVSRTYGGSQVGSPRAPFKSPLRANGAAHAQVAAGATYSGVAGQAQANGMSSWLSSTLGVDEKTVTSLLRIW